MIGDNLTRSDLKLIRSAIRNHWPVPPETRQKIVDAVARQDLDTVKPRLRRALLETAMLMANAS